MPLTPHVERHFTSGETVRDIVIGMSDGLTVPFALAAGLSGAVESTSIVITAGLAEIAAGSIAMGLGGYLAARSDAEHYASERRARALFHLSCGCARADRVGCVHLACAGRVRPRQEAFYGSQAGSERSPDGARRRPCGGRGLRDCPRHFVITLWRLPGDDEGGSTSDARLCGDA